MKAQKRRKEKKKPDSQSNPQQKEKWWKYYHTSFQPRVIVTMDQSRRPRYKLMQYSNHTLKKDTENTH